MCKLFIILKRLSGYSFLLLYKTIHHFYVFMVCIYSVRGDAFWIVRTFFRRNKTKGTLDSDSTLPISRNYDLNWHLKCYVLFEFCHGVRGIESSSRLLFHYTENLFT